MNNVKERSDSEIISGVLENFEKIAAVPHRSGHTARIADFFVAWAKEKGFKAEKDGIGNVIIDAPAKGMPETAPLVIMQTHMDMVCVAAEGKAFDPQKDPIKTVIDGDFLKADGTSLGADDGMGSAVIMDILTSDAPHGPVRFITTVDEETSMKGAEKLDGKYISGAKWLINVDSEESDTVIVSSAGSLACDAVKSFTPVKPEGVALKIKISGLKGGHSGMMIHEGRLNAVKALASIIKETGGKLCSLKGGQAKNAIPAVAEAVIAVPKSDAMKVKDICGSAKKRFTEKYKGIEKGVTVEVAETSLPNEALSAEDTAKLAAFLVECFDGVYKMSPDIEGLVQSSSNLGTAAVTPKKAEFGFMIRSSVASELSLLGDMLEKKAAEKGFKISDKKKSAAWEYKKGNVLLEKILGNYRAITGKDMKAFAIHAGLETGIFASLSPETDIVSIGPDVSEPHSPKEKCRLSSLPVTSRLIAKTLASLE